MPRGVFYKARPATTYSTAGMLRDNPLEDALLQANASRRKTIETFTKEHQAAYYAFAGISERKTAVELHNAGVTWDDIGDYTGIPGINLNAYPVMCGLSKKGYNATFFRELVKLTTVTYPHANEHLQVSTASVDTLIAVEDHENFLARFVELLEAFTKAQKVEEATTGSATIFTISPAALIGEIGKAIDMGLTADDVRHYYAAGCVRFSLMTSMASYGFSGKVCRRRQLLRKDTNIANMVQGAKAAKSFCGKNAELAEAMFLIDERKQWRTRDWLESGIDLKKIPLLHECGYTGADLREAPHLAEIDNETLEAMATLRN